MIVLKVTDEASGLRVDRFVADFCDEISRSYAATLAESGLVKVNGKAVKKNFTLSVGDEVEIDMPEPVADKAMPEDIPINVVYEDDFLLVVNKPQGMVVHPADGNYTGTLVNALLYHCKDNLSAINGVYRPGIVHRIDKDTAGLLVVAKTNQAHEALAEQLKERKASRRYLALVHGRVKEGGRIDKPIARHPVNRKKMAIVQGGREAVTNYEPIEEYTGYTLVECRLETGRTHQIRVHMSSIGHPIVGDPVYGRGNEKIKTNGQLLFARSIGFSHPDSGEYMEFSAELPDYFEKIITNLKNKN